MASQLVSNSVRKVILDAKVGPPSYEKGLAKDILSVVSFQFSPLSVLIFVYILSLWSENAILIHDTFFNPFFVYLVESYKLLMIKLL